MEAQKLLPSWAEGNCKNAIVQFLQDTTQPNSEFFLTPEERVAVFDNDGTLWVEKPMNTEVTFIKDLIFKHHELKKHGNSILGKLETAFEHVAADVLNEIDQLTQYLHEGLSTTELKIMVEKWIDTTLHPRFKTLYTNLAYQPMMEVLQLFRAHQYDCFIVSGGTSDFVRPWSPDTYGIQPQNVIGSSLRTKLVTKEEQLVLELEPMPFYFDNGAGKVKAIDRIIGKQPVAAFGNSSGDVEMLQWASQNPRSISMLIHHTDAEREYAYSPDSKFHTGESTLDKAQQSGWQIMDMKTDWLTIFSDH